MVLIKLQRKKEARSHAEKHNHEASEDLAAWNGKGQISVLFQKTKMLRPKELVSE